MIDPDSAATQPPSGDLQGSSGGVAARHTEAAPLLPLVAPTTDDAFNLIKAPLKPIACWRVDDVRFEFGSSFVKPGAAAELQLLAQLMKAHPGSPITVFGHADPTGRDDDNKTLSGRRACAIYAALSRKTELWEKLYREPQGDDRWGDNALSSMLIALAPAPANEPAADDAAAVPPSTTPPQPSEATLDDYRSDAAKRTQLYQDYMDQLCGSSFVLSDSDFLAGGQDAGGKGDYQGCGEFNPLLVLSTQDDDASDADKRRLRDASNAPNRRVLILLFQAGAQVDPAKWPCPRAADGVAGCTKRFWSDGERRRSGRWPDRSRKYDQDKDTFACRFYDRLVDGSACEQAPMPVLFRFRNEVSGEPVCQAQVQVLAPDGSSQMYITDERGEIMIVGHPGTVYRVTQIVSPAISTVASVENSELSDHA
ncbi:OmpA family protein [Dyella silvatica]|uniref:OmpA family protein n=1 Tax=Dyella silvatica TaxID=2992128 RepID=UPI00225034C6|nr:OmpA family protein [Dyella silvatica]